MTGRFLGDSLAFKHQGVLVATVTRYGSALKIAVVSPKRNQPININLPSSATLREVMGAIKKNYELYFSNKAHSLHRVER